MAWTEKLPSGRYRGLYYLPSGERRSAGTFAHKKAAKDAAIEAEAKVKRPGWRDPRVGLTTWGEWHDIWWPSRAIEPQTSASEESMIRNHVMPRWRDVPLAEIRRQDVQAWAVGLVTENLGTDDEPKYRKPSTARRVLGPFVSSLTAAVDAEVIVANPAVRIKLPPNPEPTPVFLTREQYAAIADQVSNRADRAVLDFLVGTGVRWGELAGLHVHNLNLERGVVTVVDVTDGIEIKPYPKGRRSRQVPLLQWVVDYLDVPDPPKPCGLPHRHSRRCLSGLAFPAARGGVRDDRNFTQRVFAPAVKAAGLEDLGASLHDLRHTYASWLAQDGVPLGRIAELLGHASITTTEIYAHFQPATHDDVAHALRPPQLAPTAPAAGGLRAVK
ncbi:tyrosine-type recombinase/integrase [Microbacterium jejuense]|uniref:Tyrosine-type recombinase/integrase n=1 Tax=Microbacterium jejuense TaxID=1263637 RepID=A0ABS7HR82_9MICO|nr:tyrosine-type recombinase/integrase [Microbacterium jejuense]MBW9095173.1 tyrosine-type recombinase/integrase [Microbacterium jejuense]